MTLQTELLHAILSMDSYNRGYDQGIVLATNIDGGSPGIQIGTAIITTESDIDPGTDGRNAGFYALAYDLDGDSTADVISYRGTDYPRTLPLRDVAFGWTLGAGELSSPQGEMAVEFYQAVTGPGNHFTSGITLTGHSLGGGLAGFVGELYNMDAFIYDSMTYDLAAARATNYVTSSARGIRRARERASPGFAPGRALVNRACAALVPALGASIPDADVSVITLFPVNDNKHEVLKKAA